MIARKSFLIVSSQYFTRILGMIGLIVLAKLWGGFHPNAMGVVGFAMSFLAIFNIFADLGFSAAHVKRVSEGKDLGTCIGTYATIKLILTSLVVVSVLVYIYVWKNFFNGGFTDATTESVVHVFILYYIFYNLFQIITYTFEGKNEIAKRQITGIFENVVKVPLEIIVALAGVNMIGVAVIAPSVDWPSFLQPIQEFFSTHVYGSFAMTYVLGAMTTFIVGVWLIRKYPLKRPSWVLFKSYIIFALPILFLSVIGIISVNIDKIMIGYFWTNVEVGYYYAFQQILQIISVLSGAIGIVLFPSLSGYHSIKNFDKIKKVTRLAERYISLVMIPVIVVIIVFAKPVTEIMLNSSYLPALSVLITLLIYTFITSLMVPYTSLISGVDKPVYAAIVGSIMCAVNIALNILFIPQEGLLSTFGINGPTGAATATVMSSCVGFIGLRLAAKKLTGIKLLQSHTPRHLIAGLIMGGVLFYINTLLPVIRWYTLAGLSLFGLAIYLAVLYVIREFKKEDFIFFLDLIHPKKMLSYVKSEFKEK